MKSILLISDTHRETAYYPLIQEQIATFQPDLLIHLGDYYDDMSHILEGVTGHVPPLIQVPGTWTSFYQNPMIDNRRFEEIEGWTLFLTHTPDRHSNDLGDDPDPEMVLKEKNAMCFYMVIHMPHKLKKRMGLLS